jgi:hypothetical protein
MIDIFHLQPGDKVRLRNGDIETVTRNDKDAVPILLSNGKFYFPGGEYNSNLPSHRLDIVEILAQPETTYGPGMFSLTFSIVTTPDKGVTAIVYGDKRFTPADAWPDAINDRNPTRADGDEACCVLRLDTDGDWMTCEWDSVDVFQCNVIGWARTPKWTPQRLDKKSLTLRDLRYALRDGDRPDEDTLRSAIELLEAQE